MPRTRSLVGAVSVAAMAACATPVAADAAGGTVKVRCAGDRTSCTARVSLAGGASNERVVIALHGRHMRLVSTRVNRRSLRGAYEVSDQHRRHGGRQYVMTLNADQAIPRGSYLLVRFRAQRATPARIVRCRGGSLSCTAKVRIAGGASNRRVVIQLSDVDLALHSVRPNRASLRGAYSVTDQRLRHGGSELAFTLNADQAIPAGSYLTFSFRQV